MSHARLAYGGAVAWLLLCAVLLCAAPALAAEDRFLELRAAYTPGTTGKHMQLVSRARLTFESSLDNWTLVGTVEAALQTGRSLSEELERTLRCSDFGPVLEGANCQFHQHTNRVLGISSADGYLDVDRLYADYYHEYFDVRLGRQAIYWGSAQFINPTDPFFQFLLAEPWRPRRGINAARLTVPFGALNELTLVAAANDTFTSGGVAGRVRVNWLATDWALVGAYRGETEQGFVGVDIRGTLLLGWWIEAALKMGNTVYEEIAVGVDYSFPVFESLLVSAQYYRNGSGATHPDRYARGGISNSFEVLQPPDCVTPIPLFAQSQEPRDPFGSPLAGTDYLLLNVSAGITPDISASVAGLQNLHDGTAVFIPTLITHPIPWMDLAVSAQIPVALWGPGGEFKPRPEDLTLRVPTPSGQVLTADLSGLVPAATVTLWMRGNF